MMKMKLKHLKTPKTTPLSSPRMSSRNEESSPDSPPRKTRGLQEIYYTCNFATMELESSKVAAKHKVWIKAMEEEIKMIRKNKMRELVD